MPHLKPVTVGRYSDHGHPESPYGGHGFVGWVETEDWIVWEAEDGSLYVANGREPNGGVDVWSIVPRGVEDTRPDGADPGVSLS